MSTIKYLLRISSLIVFLMLSLKPAYALQSPWKLQEGETMMEATFIGYTNGEIHVLTNEGDLFLSPDANIFTALIGEQGGYQVLLNDFPPYTEVELYTNADGYIRDMRNKQLPQKNLTPSDDSYFTSIVSPVHSSCPLVVTSLVHDQNSILITALQDYKEIGSDIFFLSVLDLEGCLINKKTVPCLGNALYFDQEHLLFVTYENMEIEGGKLVLWNFLTDEIYPLLSPFEVIDFAFERKTKTIAFTTAHGIGEILYLYNFSTQKTDRLFVSAYPLQNLHWSSINTLYFEDLFTSNAYSYDRLSNTLNKSQADSKD